MQVSWPTIAPHTWRRAARYTVLGIVVVLAAAIFAVTTARAQESLGPHEAEYSMTTSGVVVVDLGPLGTIELDSPLPLNLGVDVQVEAIPKELQSVGPAQTLEALGGDLTAYMQFFSGPQATIADVTAGIIASALIRFVLALVVLVAVWTLIRLMLGATRRRELATAFLPHIGHIAGGLVLVVLVATVSTGGLNRLRPDDAPGGTTVFAGTPLEGARITGRLAGVIDTYGGKLVHALEDNQAFYDAAADDLTDTWTRTVAHDDALALLAPPANDSIIESGEPGDPREFDEPVGPAQTAGTADPGNDADLSDPADPADPASTDPETTDAPSRERSNEDDIVTMLLVSDLHCNIGMATVIERAASLSGANLIVNGGDTTINGSTVEKFCVTAFAKAAPAGVKWVSVTGNHDSVATAKDMSDAGMIVLDDAPVDVSGVRFLGAPDPNETRIGVGTQAIGTKTIAETGSELTEKACLDKKGVDVLLVHTPYVGTEVLGSGCVPAQFSGHLHRRVGPDSVGAGIRYTSSTTAGAAENELTVGPLKGVAEMTILRFDRATRTILDFQLVTINPEGKAAVGARMRFPRAGEVDADGVTSTAAARDAWREENVQQDS